MAGETKMVSVSSIQKGSYLLLDGAPCRVTDIQVSRPGKHGHAKIHIIAVGLLDEKKREAVMPGHDNVHVPIVDKRSAQVLAVQGDTANVMDAETYEAFDLKIPEELKGKCVEGCQVLYWVIMDTKIMKQIKGSE